MIASKIQRAITMKKLAMLLGISLLFSCDKVEVHQTPIDSDILIEVNEIGSASSRIVIKGKTEREYNCFNYTIATTKRYTQKNIDITFKAIEGNNTFATAIGPATTEIDLGTLPNG